MKRDAILNVRLSVCLSHALGSKRRRQRWPTSEARPLPPVYLGVTLDRTLSYREHLSHVVQ